MSSHKKQTVTILGAGSIGVSFAAVMIDADYSLELIDPDASRRELAKAGITYQLGAIREAGLLRGGQGSLSISGDAPRNLARADLVLECGPENLEAKQNIFASLLETAGTNTLLATASSAIPMSQIVPSERDQARCLVAHPVNPPSVLRLIEIVPAAGTSAASITRASTLFSDLGFSPVTLTAEIEGFVVNRLQGAVLREAYRLVDDGIVEPNDVDAAMSVGLGPRWALSGPFETAELNTPGGLPAHARRMGPAYKRMGEARGETVNWTTGLVEKVTKARRNVLPEDQLPARTAWRIGAVAKLVKARNKVLNGEND